MREYKTVQAAWKRLAEHGEANVSSLTNADVRELRAKAKAEGMRLSVPAPADGKTWVATLVRPAERDATPDGFTYRHVRERVTDGQRHPVTVKKTAPKGRTKTPEQARRAMMYGGV